MKLSQIENNGFSLVELIVVMAMIGILLSIATLNFYDWQLKSNIEKNTNDLHTDLTELRQKAMTRKMEHNVTLNAGNYVFRQFTSSVDNGNAASSKILTKVVTTPLSNSSGTPLNNLIIRFDERGYATSNETIVVGPTVSSASVNCMIVSSARINLGKMNGGVCEFK